MGGQFGQGLFEVGDEVGGGFEADVQPHDAIVVRRAPGPVAHLVGHREAGDASPTVADTKELEGIDEGVNLFLRGAGFEDKGEHAGGAEKIALPELVAGAGVESWVQDAFDFRAGGEPPGDGLRGSFNGREADGEGLESAEGEAAVVGRGGATDELLGFAQTAIERFVADGNGAKKDVAMTADVLGEGLHGGVDAVREGVEKDAGRPGVVEDNEDITGMGGGDDGGEVLNFHGDGAGAFAPDEASVFFDVGRDSGADGGVVKIGRDAEAGEEMRGEFAVGVVNTGRNENVIAGLEESEVDEGDGGLASGREDRAVAGLELADTRGEFEDGGSAVKAVGVADAPLVPGVGDDGGGRKKSGGAAEGG